MDMMAIDLTPCPQAGIGSPVEHFDPDPGEWFLSDIYATPFRAP
jgi:alanine racemase